MSNFLVVRTAKHCTLIFALFHIRFLYICDTSQNTITCPSYTTFKQKDHINIFIYNKLECISLPNLVT